MASPAIEKHSKQVAYLRQLHLNIFWAVAALAALCFVLDVLYHSPLLRIFGIAAVVLCINTLLKIRLLQRRNYNWFVVLIGVEFAAYGLSIGLISPLAMPVVMLYPAIMYAVGATFLSDVSLKRVSILALAMSMAGFIANLFFLAKFPEPWYVKLIIILGVLITQIVVFILSLQARQHQNTLLAESQAANNALRQMHEQLEHTVDERTGELAQTVSLLRGTLEATADGIIVADNNHRVVAWNGKFSDMWRIPAEMMAERDIQLLLRYVSTQLCEPEIFLQLAQEMYQAVDAKSFETLYFKDGRVFERYSQPQTVDGTIIGRVLSFRDITERVRSDERARAFASLGRELSATITVEDAARTIIHVADELFGWDACYLDFYYPEDQTLQTIVCIDTQNGQRVEMPLPPASVITSDEHRMLRQGAQLVLREPETLDSGDYVPFGDTNRPSASLMFAPILRGNLTIGMLSIQSYTYNAYTEADLATFQSLASHCAGALERNRSEAALKRAEEERQQLERKMLETQKRESLGVLAGGIAHDFNNLLTVMQGNITLARLDLESNHEALESLQQAETAARRAADLTRQMLAYAGKGKISVGRVELNDMLCEMRDLLYASLPKHIRFDYQLESNLPWIEADATQIRQVIMNLIVNATEAIGNEQGEVVVRTSLVELADFDVATTFGAELAPGSYVSLEIKDTGAGMDDATIGRIFEPFFTTKFTGRGLGLAAVLGIARSHHGAIRVRSQFGQGTSFQILLPPASSPEMIAPAAEQEAPWRGYGAVLVIDDEPAIRSLVTRMIGQIGFDAHVAEHGDAGVEVYRALAGDLAIVLLDLTMPGKNPQQVLADFHAINPATPVLLMSGYTEQDAQSLRSHPQVIGFLHKPFRLAELRGSLQQALSQGTGVSR